MTYPLSVEVTAGEATEAGQYNRLRADALYLGGEPGTSGNLRDLLFQGCGTVRLSRASAVSVRLEASADEPCALMIEGKIFTVSSDVSVSVDPGSFPEAERLWLYAAGGSGPGFTLRTGTASAPPGCRRIGTFLWSGTGIIPGTVHEIREWELLQKNADPGLCQGRLTLVPGEPVSDADIRLAGSLYFTPYQGDRVSLYLNGSWETFRFTELSLSLSGLMREIPYDIFLEADAGGLHLSALTWGTAAARPSGMLARVEGIRVSGVNSRKRYLGTVALNASGYGEDSCTGRLVWNENHRLPRPLLSRLTTVKAQGSPHMGSWAPYYDEDAPSVRLLVPFPETDLILTGVGISSPISENDRDYGRASAVGICRDMMTSDPYTGNESCVPVFTHNFGNSPVRVSLRNRGGDFLGLHTYTLAFWSNYTFFPSGTNLTSHHGGVPGLEGEITG